MPIKLWVAILLRTTGKKIFIAAHPSKAYCWDKAFEHIEAHHGPDVLESADSRACMRARAIRLGYQVLAGSLTTDETN